MPAEESEVTYLHRSYLNYSKPARKWLQRDKATAAKIKKKKNQTTTIFLVAQSKDVIPKRKHSQGLMDQPPHSTSSLCCLTHTVVPAPNFQELQVKRLLVKCRRQLQKVVQLKTNTRLLLTPVFPENVARMV